MPQIENKLIDPSQLMGAMFGEALLTMAKTITEMEKQGKSAEQQLNFCILPILNKVQKEIPNIKHYGKYHGFNEIQLKAIN